MSTVEIISQDPPTIEVLSTTVEVVEVVAAGPQGLPGYVVVRSVQVVSAASVTLNANTTDLIDITALAEALTFEAPIGTPTNGQRLLVRIKDNGVSRVITWNGAFVSGGVPLLAATIPTKITHLGFFYNANISKWMLIAQAAEG